MRADRCPAIAALSGRSTASGSRRDRIEIPDLAPSLPFNLPVDGAHKIL
jgi:hypothetical protein